MAKISHAIYLLCCFGFFSFSVYADEENINNKDEKSHYVPYYESDNVTNQIPYFDNRFRLDAKLEEITLIFYRKSGTPPIILVQPDGSKLKVTNHPKEKVEWYDDRTFDMIKIKKPMPGPWQAIGDILPQSKIMVVSDVTIDVAPIPEIVLAGETLKMAGKLVNKGVTIDNPLFRDVISLKVDFYSTNNSAYDNFGSAPINLTTFRDDGEELDEYEGDGVFTGEFLLDFAPGEWVPVYVIKLPMLTRELRQKPIVIQRNPIEISVETTLDKKSSHKVIFTINPEFVDPDSILFQGNYTTPDRQVEPFSIMEGSGEKRIEEFAYTEPGIHRIKTNVFGKTKEGREFRLVVPEFAFNVEAQEVLLAPDLDDSSSNALDDNDPLATQKALAKSKKQAEMELKASIEKQRLANEKAEEEMIFLIVVINGVIIFGVAMVFIFLAWKKKKKAKAS